ncbi:MAG TPA: tRNA uridine-5-carboxymethylaminomethyl(34) synthesis enzyme MnmG [Candidatus Margulisbacteria bacterium]|nr:MAG: tRNA uridine-5-carboxymethylaminomethyl(34) synthesis enzyme MnmG [Candidatus Margulisbacteria bacterium GWD2_39_127]OGI02393.1 MAG: tRNA uridine-5-carboxymethylaminomethyl(34) synthesis enzyme MnmG [Candidatus Margulisbacteria bacterium GWF2_38_17]OGI08525.1 MAG: tRNA uridine-5-carboxymethylaminomethyl(34) synthesis enzyme MnmG [Candidatus Margulisbacteria bacterium GWE2_39_32]HAR63436.1 tRNA uridine-5-carboxymethylaminomethyl(34) synthesis enzyme MnmG [Candidatus Margulisiibacteriota b
MIYPKHYDVIVIGGGHAGVEAALASSRMGCSTLMLTINLDRIGYMPCNPAIGGPGKSHIVSEIDALGGQMSIAADMTYIQMKVLNRSKGPAVQSLRAQSDKLLYQVYMKKTCENQANLEIKQDMVTDISVDNSNYVKSVKTILGVTYEAACIIVTTGTFLNGIIHTGFVSQPAGRLGEQPSVHLSDSLKALGLNLGRLKTGTTPRLDGRTINYEKIVIQPGDEDEKRFSFFHPSPARAQIPCYLTHTNLKTHEIILNNLDRSPLYAGKIKGIGPRYCPSIEDKIVRFSDKSSHHLFVEPEGLETNEIYIQGFNTSLPVDVQIEALHSISGLESVVVMRPGYAVEYDFVFPYQLKYNLETKSVQGLFLAGQINGTSGYEEAAGQGLMAGINAALKVKGKESLILSREESYIGLLIDDLINKDIQEPYRMMTARAEYRLLLRQDNADRRLLEKGYGIGLVAKPIYDQYITKQKSIRHYLDSVEKNYVYPNEITNDLLASFTTSLRKKLSYAELLQRVEVTWKNLSAFDGFKIEKDFPYGENVEIEVKYKGYIERIDRQIQKSKDFEKKKIPAAVNYKDISGLRKEAAEKLDKIRPENLGQASRISGVNPADISVLVIYLHKNSFQN